MSVGDKPPGWHGKAQKAARAAAVRDKRLARVAAKKREAAFRSSIDKSLAPVRAAAEKALARLGPKKPRTGNVRKLYSGEAARAAAEVSAAEKAAERDFLADKWSYKNEGTPETHERFNSVPQRRRDWPLARMARLGTIDADELASGEEIASIIDMIERQVGVGAASLEARVDYSASARDALVESIGRVRMEVAYTNWRAAIPEPRRMILDMLTTRVSYVELARIHGMHWRTARKILIRALRLWPRFWHEANDIEREDVEAIYRRIGTGTLLQPKPKNEEPAGSIADHDSR